MKSLLPLTCLAFFLTPLASADCPEHQLADARTKAKAENKDVLMVFLGDEKDGLSKKVKKETLQNEAFKTEAANHFVTHIMEFPQSAKATDKSLLTIKETYQIRRLPVIIQTDFLGRPYGFANLISQDSTKVMEGLKANLEIRKKRDAAFAKAEKAEGVEKAKAIVEGLEPLPQFVIRDFYTAELAAIAQADPEGETELVARIEKAEKLDQEQKRYQQLFKAEKFQKIVELSQKESSETEGEDAQRISMYGIQALASLNKYDEAKSAIDAMAKLSPETTFGKSADRYKGVVERIKKRNERKSAPPAEEAPKKEAAPEEAPLKKAPEEKAPEEAPKKEAAPEEAPLKKAPEEEAPEVEAPAKGATSAIVSKPVAVVTDIKKLRKEAKLVGEESTKAQTFAISATQAQREADAEMAKLTKRLEELKAGKAQRDEAAAKARTKASRLAKKNQMMQDVIESHEAMERRRREISDLEKKASDLQEEAQELRKKAGEIKKSK